MTLTPWGDVRELRARRRASRSDDTARNPERELRERIFAAMVTSVAERGYAATRVADLVELAGATREEFDELFESRLDCFVQALEAIVVLAEAAMAVELVRDEPWDARLRRSFAALIDLIVAHPAAARMCMVDSYEAGPEAVAYLDRMTRAAGRRAVAVLEQSPERAGIPRDVARAVIGGLRKVLQTRLYGGREDELPGLAPALMDWALGYRAPPVALRPAPAPAPRPSKPPSPHANGASDARRQRIVAAVTEIVAAKGYADTTVTEVAETAELSLESFYAHFEDKRGAFGAGLDDAVWRMLEMTLPAYRDAQDWPHGIRDGLRELLGQLSLDPATARFTVEAVWGGPEALTRLDAAMSGFAALLAEGLRGRSAAPGIVAEAIGSSILTLTFERTLHGDAARLYELAPPATFVALAPAVGAIEACAVINGN